jgi:hypothetical protein
MAPSNGNLYYAAASDGSVWFRNDVGVSAGWTEADLGLLGQESGFIWNIRVDPADANHAFAVSNGVGGKRVWVTTSGGVGDPFTGWVDITGDLPQNLRALTIAPDWRFASPVLYVGTTRGVYVSTNQGAHWFKLTNGLPNTPVNDLQIATNFNILAAATVGRGAWEILLAAQPPQEPSQIVGTVFNDHNANGQQDGEDEGLSGRTVFLDLNTDGVHQNNEPMKTTDANGAYSFSNLTLGNYTVAEVLPAQWRHTTPTAFNVTLADDTNPMEVDFGTTQSPLSGTVFKDDNANGVQDAAESGLGNWTVYLDLNHDGAREINEPTATTDGDGAYAFANLAAGSYTVRDVLPSVLWKSTTPVAVDVVVTADTTAARADFGNICDGCNIHPDPITKPGPISLDTPEPDPGTDISLLFRIRLGLPVFNPATGQSRQKVTLRNVSTQTLSGPLMVQLDGLGHQAKLRRFKRGGSRWMAMGHKQSSFSLGEQMLQPGASLTVTLEFSNVRGHRLHFEPHVLVGQR